MTFLAPQKPSVALLWLNSLLLKSLLLHRCEFPCPSKTHRYIAVSFLAPQKPNVTLMWFSLPIKKLTLHRCDCPCPSETQRYIAVTFARSSKTQRYIAVTFLVPQKPSVTLLWLFLAPQKPNVTLLWLSLPLKNRSPNLKNVHILWCRRSRLVTDLVHYIEILNKYDCQHSETISKFKKVERVSK